MGGHRHGLKFARTAARTISHHPRKPQCAYFFYMLALLGSSGTISRPLEPYLVSFEIYGWAQAWVKVCSHCGSHHLAPPSETTMCIFFLYVSTFGVFWDHFQTPGTIFGKF